jgi:RNA polymerase sigma-70 factor (ECF subfamily)
MELAAAYNGEEMVSEIEPDVVLRWTEGNKEAFEVLVRRYMHDAYMIALAYTGDPDDARDLSQEAFIKAYRARRRFDPQRPFFPWFYRILKNHCLNFVQRVRRKTESLYYENEPGSERFASERPTPLEHLEREERVRIMRAAIDQLSDEHREVILLKNFQGFSYKEMAETLGIPIGTVMSRLYYARKALKDLVDRIEQAGTAGAAPDRAGGRPVPGEVS